MPKECSMLSKLVLVLVAVSAVSCTIPGHGIAWPKLVQCAPDVSDAVGTVGRILLADGDDSSIGQRGKRELADLAARVGPKTVACLIERLVSDWTAPGASQDPLLIHSAERGRAFLAEVGTQAELAEEAW
jgi:hypothetical protein